MNKNILKLLFVCSSLLSLQVYAGSGTEWSYEGTNGAEYWGDLDPAYSTCKTGSNQSPVDITEKTKSELEDLNIYYSSSPKEILNNGHTIQINIQPGSYFEVDGVNFELLQYHFHTPSENRVDGKVYPLEMHLVHSDPQGNLAVIGVFFEYGDSNESLVSLWANMPTHLGDVNSLESVASNINQLLPDGSDYYRFSGSLTTPPCSEGVRWFVMKDALEASQQQVEEFLHTIHHENNRPVQPLNGRVINLSD
jgi:carbonic anhydrase